MQTLIGKDIFDWLYALNPLLAGEIRFVIDNLKLSRNFIKLFVKLKYVQHSRIHV